MEVKYPNYLQDKDDDDHLLKIFKQAGRNEANEIYKTGIDSNELNTIRIATEFGDDMKVPLIMSPFIRAQAECRYLADIRFLIENYIEGESLPLWRERYHAFNLLQDRLATSGSINKAQKFSNHRQKGSVSDQTKYIQKLVSSNPKLSAKELNRIADNKIVADITEGTFRNKVSAAKRQIKLKK